ncbi:beta-1,3-galactosyl-O-glycosyl-glycoprotein beta-1,6-N-acetylglucosaminyltransferase 4-like [Asterias rubens]|uniref:beta-1,3-galactosyl-O-glycosyl-glycoprotein beta-1,6-N-acetylglucosaminyltransferase 4-like n=1 Tax=Asterias rubens TaxID=7604 RepID=UPI00145545AF|nr:beta-1,3-galactosyl-O-glycosyl-glycoprotein beta-1,6-N-acetylglucosaminyltransferase 4-like [Asterias rubens]
MIIILGLCQKLLTVPNTKPAPSVRLFGRVPQRPPPPPVNSTESPASLSHHSTTDDVSSRNSFTYHRHWDVNCPVLFAGDSVAVRDTAESLARERARNNGSLPVPSDVEVRQWTQDCKAFRSGARYPTHPMSTDEAKFPIAYTIITHTTSAQVERLLRAIYQPQNIYCIHPDLNSPHDFHRAIRGIASCFPNVFIASKLEEVQYAGFTRLRADLNCMNDLIGPQAAGFDWRYLINLCGQDFPLKTNLEIVRQLQFYNGTNDVKSIVPYYVKERWTSFHHIIKNGKVTQTKFRKTPPPHNFTVYNGNAYFAGTRQFIEYALKDRHALDLLEWSKDTYSPDENFWSTLHRAPGAPGGFPVSSSRPGHAFRFVKWENGSKPDCLYGTIVRLVCIFAIDYLQYLSAAPNLFANKFHYSFDPVTIQCLEEQLDFRSTHPLESNHLPKFPTEHMKRP